MGERASGRFVAKDFCKFLSKPVLRMGELARLGIIIALPDELANGGETQPNEKQGESIDVVANAIEHVVAQVKSMHQRPGVVRHLGADDLVRKLGKFRCSQGNLILDG